MKKVVFVFFLVLFINFSFAQNAHLGFKGGLNVFNLQYKDGNSTDYKTSFHAGLLSHIHVTNKFAIQPEVVYSEQGGETQIRNNEYRVKLNYINVPVLAQYMFGKGYRLEAGPQVGFLVNAKEKYLSTETNAANVFKKVDYSLAVGFGYLSHAKIGVDLRWVFGLRDINNSTVNGRTYNNGAQLGLFYQFDHRGKK